METSGGGTAYQPPAYGYGAPQPHPLPGALAPGVARPGVAAPSTAVPPGTHVALLAPITGVNAERGGALVQAAELALSEPGSPALDVHDTGSTPAGAAAAAQSALAGGAGLIIGPLTAAETAAVAPAARAAGVAVLAFTNDAAQAQPGVWTLGITPAQQLRRMAGALIAQGKNRFAALLPPGDFGAAMAQALTQVLAAAGAPPPDIHIHDGSDHDIAAQLRAISQYDSRGGPVDARIKAAIAKHTAEGRKEAAELRRHRDVPPPPFDALVMADTGEKLYWASTFLQYYDITNDGARLLGPALWASAGARGGASIAGAWFAAPDPAARATFDAAYTAKFGSHAPGLADVAYDAAAIARVLAAQGGFSAASLCRPEGFAGADGVLALQPDGTVRRGLAIFAVQPGGPVIVDPAPADLSAPGT